jgi:CDP-diglyceride synthetase
MKETILFLTPAWLIAIIIMIIMLICIKIGAVIGNKKLKEDLIENTANKTIFGSVFGLFAFLLAISFSMSGNRFEQRRAAAVSEAKAISVAIMRADLYPAEERAAFRKDLRDYVQGRMDYISGEKKKERLDPIQKRIDKAEHALWERATRLSKNSTSIMPSVLMTPALNDMFDSAIANNYSELQRVPESIVIMLFILSFVSAFFVGYISADNTKLDRYVVIGFCFLSSMVIYIILDLDRPRRGLVTLDISKSSITSQMHLLEHD